MAQKHILIICGEASGDLHAANLTKKLLEINPGMRISGVGGPLMRKTGAQVFYDIKDLAVIGFFDALKKLPTFFALRKLVLQKIKAQKPDAVILVDFSGFNLRLAKKVNNTIPLIYYISPQVWASRPGRVRTIKEHIHKMLVIFKFEEEFYRSHGIDATFIGHPLLDIVRPTMAKEEFMRKFNLAKPKTTIALLPGSRRQEIENILPVMLETSLLINKEIRDLRLLIAKSPQIDWDTYNRKIQGLNMDLEIIENRTYDCLNIANFCLVASGTATLETAIMQKPFAIIYKMGLLNYFFYLPQVKVPYIGLVNILAKRKIIPEFIQFKARPRNIAESVLKILQNPSEIERMKNALGQVKLLLGEKGASLRASQIIINFLN